ncbi:MAG: right-handed parallel beta-helix repeat-containing protein [Myxococcaceae bacterium]|nr:right-handed parallel beta-helix repeat-containing protein [Myxococcaceae bacterium]
MNKPIALVLACCAACNAPSPTIDRGSAGGSTAGTGGGSSVAGGSNTAGGTATAGGTGVVATGSGPSLITTVCPTLALPTVTASLYVDTAAAAAGMGSRALPFRTLTEAFDAASDGDVIWVAGGTYRAAVTVPDKNLTVLGGFSAGFDNRFDACVTVFEAPLATDSIVTVPDGVRRFTLEGVTLLKGAHGLYHQGDSSNQGTLTITRTVFRENGQPGVGEETIGGGALVLDADVTFSGCVFRDNQGAKGGAIGHGGPNATITIDQCLFDSNSANSDHGGAVYVTPKLATVTRSTFRRNEVGRQTNGGWGGAFLVFRADDVTPAHADLAYNVFTENIATQGAAVFVDDGATATMSHDLIYRNRSILENGVGVAQALLVDGLADGNPARGSRLTGDHLTIVNNLYDRSGAVAPMNRGGAVAVMQAAQATLTNSVLWNNGPEELRVDTGCSLTVRYAIAQSACVGGGTCSIGAGVTQPATLQFTDEPMNDYRERSPSAIIDGAEPGASFAFEPMPNGGRANLGAFGNTTQAAVSQ